MNKLGKYEIRRPLGKGGMGVVYEGFDPVIERTVAIKTILPAQLNGADAVAIMARFRREAQAAGRLNHPNIVAVYEYGEDIAQDISAEEATMLAASPSSAPRVAYIAMEFVQGRELKDYLDKGERFALPEIVRLMGEMLDALDHAHAQGVVHRDMKPANLILLEGGRLKVADFGIARVEASQLTQTGTVMGTPSYMSPEQFMGQTVDGRSDLFSCGVILYQLLTGERPFTGETSTTIMYKVLREDPVPPSALNLSITPELEAVVTKALAKQPAARFQNGRAFAAALRAAASTTGQEAPLAFGTAAGTAPAAAPPPGGRTHRNAGAWAVGFAAVVALGAGGYLLLGPGKNRAPAMASASSGPAATVVPAAAPAAAASGDAAAALATGTAVVAPPLPLAMASPPAEPGTLVISALGQADPQDTRFKGSLVAAQEEARSHARRQLVEKALALQVERGSLESHYGLFEQKLLARSDTFIRTVLQESAAGAGSGGRLEAETRAVVSLRDVQRSLNQLSREERIEFIRNKGDPRISIAIDIGSAEAATPLPKERSQLAENVVKERIKSFGFRVWSPDGQAQPADFAIRGEARLKQLSAKLPASGLTITKTALTSWTLKAVELASGEEVYLSTQLPTGKTWATQDQALAEIGKLVGDEFSRNFFLQHFNFRTQRTTLLFTGLPDSASGLMQRELQGIRAVLDSQRQPDGRFQLQLPEGSAPDIVQEAIVRPLNAKLGQDCLALAGASGTEVRIAFSPACGTPEMRTRFGATPPAGWRAAPAQGGTRPAAPPRPSA